MGPKKRAQTTSKKKKKPATETCINCGKKLPVSARALFVEEEIGRIFCSESCIVGYFSPEISTLERAYFKRLNETDLPVSDRENLGSLRWKTLKEPGEVWCEKMPSGDHRYTLITEYKFKGQKIWNVCICLFLRGEPSFLFLAFPSKLRQLVDAYRTGEQLELGYKKKPKVMDAEVVLAEVGDPTEGDSAQAREGGAAEDQAGEGRFDGLGTPWTSDETQRASRIQKQKPGDIPEKDYTQYQRHLEETLQVPDEVWMIQGEVKTKSHLKTYHFLRHYPETEKGLWYVVVAREVGDDEMIEIIDAFPTRNTDLVEQYRRGKREIGGGPAPAPSSSRLVH